MKQSKMSHTMRFLCCLHFPAMVSNDNELENQITGSSLPITSTITPPQPFKQLGRVNTVFFPLQLVELSRTSIQLGIPISSTSSTLKTSKQLNWWQLTPKLTTLAAKKSKWAEEKWEHHVAFLSHCTFNGWEQKWIYCSFKATLQSLEE